jgi:hypothetical protein
VLVSANGKTKGKGGATPGSNSQSEIKVFEIVKQSNPIIFLDFLSA